MDGLRSSGKPFDISNKGAPGVDGRSVEDFEKDLKGNPYRIWNRMSSGSYFPPPVRAVDIPKAHGEGTRRLGVPTVADRIGQTVVARRLEARSNRPSTRIPTATGRGGRRLMRSGSAGGGAGSATG